MEKEVDRSPLVIPSCNLINLFAFTQRESVTVAQLSHQIYLLLLGYATDQIAKANLLNSMNVIGIVEMKSSQSGTSLLDNAQV